MPPGRRWSVLHYLPAPVVLEDGLHRIGGLGSATGTMDPRLEYRWTFDVARGLWRCDVRVTAQAGAAASD